MDIKDIKIGMIVKRTPPWSAEADPAAGFGGLRYPDPPKYANPLNGYGVVCGEVQADRPWCKVNFFGHGIMVTGTEFLEEIPAGLVLEWGNCLLEAALPVGVHAFRLNTARNAVRYRHCYNAYQEAKTAFDAATNRLLSDEPIDVNAEHDDFYTLAGNLKEAVTALRHARLELLATAAGLDEAENPNSPSRQSILEAKHVQERLEVIRLREAEQEGLES